jgi:hypothetical protein
MWVVTDTNKKILYVLQIIHLFIDFFCMSYIYIFNPIYDIYFCGFILLQTIHWALLKNECIVSYVEKKLIDPNYELGAQPKWIPHYDVFYNTFLKTVKAICIIGGLLYVMFRNDSNIIRAICVAAILLWIYLKYFHGKPRI